MTEKFWIALKAIVLDNMDNVLVLFKSLKEDVNPNDFDIPWWRINFGEDLQDALKRECREELNINIQIIKPINTWWFVKNDLHLVWITFLTKYIWWEISLSNEHSNCFWKSKDEILNWNFPDRLKNEIKNI